MSSEPPPDDGLAHQEVQSRLRNLPRDLVIAFAARCALRVSPLTALRNGTFPEKWAWIEARAPWHAVLASIRYCFAEAAGIFDVGAYAKTVRATHSQTANAVTYALSSTPKAVAASAAAAASAVNPDPRAVFTYALSAHNDARAAIAYYFESGWDGLSLVNVHDACILEDIERLESFESLNKLPVLAAFFSAPLWGAIEEDSRRILDPQFATWIKALNTAAVRNSEKSRLSPSQEVQEIERQFRGFAYGTPDWDAILGSELWDEVRSNQIGLEQRRTVVEEPQPEASLAPHINWPSRDSAQLVARLAYADPSLMASAERPSLEAISAALNARGFKTAHPQLIFGALASATDHFEPDPLWLAWVRAAHPQFFSDLAGWQPTPAEKPIPPRRSFQSVMRAAEMDSVGEVPKQSAPQKSAPSISAQSHQDRGHGDRPPPSRK